MTKGSQFFLACDLSAGYWQYELDYERSRLTTCLTEFGKFRFTKLAMGCSPSRVLFNQTTVNIVQEMEDMLKEVDNMLLLCDTLEGIPNNLEDMLTRCKRKKSDPGTKKLKFCTNVLFAGLHVTQDGCSADPEKMETVSTF